MEYNCSVYIVDEIMGRGKSWAAINYMNSHDDEKFLYITPYLDEITERIIPSCPNKEFITPDDKRMGTKTRHLKSLLNKGKNIASTHALFKRFDEELIEICRAQNYTLIMDEVTEVVEKYEIGPEDLNTLMEKYVDLDEKTNLFHWRESKQNYKDQKFLREKRFCDLGCLGKYGEDVMMWLFPIQAFNAFRKVYILTYLFNAQIQRYYYDFYKLPYSYLYVKGDSIDTYSFSTEYSPTVKSVDYKSLIHIYDDDKLNAIGDMPNALSKTWYMRHCATPDSVVIKKLKGNIYNYFHNITNSKSGQTLWTTFVDYEKRIKGRGFASTCIACNLRATNMYRDRTTLVYAINKYLHVYVKGFFIQNNISVDEDGYALSEMLQWIWRSAIRDGKPIWIYIPSSRMRGLLQQWIEDNSIEDNSIEDNF